MRYAPQDLAVTFFALYRQLAPDQQTIPRGTNALDHAIKKAAQALPDNEFARAFHFADAHTGLECIELRDMESYAQSAGTLTFPEPYITAQFEISTFAAQALAPDPTPHDRAFVAKVKDYFLKNAPAGI